MRKLFVGILFVVLSVSCGLIPLTLIAHLAHRDVCSSLPVLIDSSVPEHLVDCTVLVENATGCGSGILFTKGDVTFVWTAAHVMRGQKECIVTQKIYRNGRTIAELKSEAKLIAYSAEVDLALMEVTQQGFTKASISFYEGPIPQIGTEVYHVGNYACRSGEFSLAAGIIAHLNRHSKTGGSVDQTTALVFPGSSGGGVYLKDGQCIGVVLSMAAPGASFFVPIRIMREWARSAGVEWAITHSLPTPADRHELLRVPD